MAPMYVIVNVTHGDEMNNLMMTLANKHYTFSVTDNISKVCSHCLSVTEKEEQKIEDIVVSSTKLCGIRNRRESDIVLETEGCSLGNSPENSNCTSTLSTENSNVINPTNDTHISDENLEEHSHFKTSLSLNEASTSTCELGTQQLQMLVSAIKEKSNDLMQINELENKNAKTANIEESPSVTENDFYPGHAAILKRFNESFENSYIQNRKDHRGKCDLCEQPISIRTHHMRRHAITHLGFKTFQCRLCKMNFNRADMCKPHFERHHPSVPQIPFEDVMTHEQAYQLQKTLKMCFPKRTK